MPKRKTASRGINSEKDIKFGVFSLIWIYYFSKKKQKYNNPEDSEKWVLCNDLIIFHLAKYIPKVSGGVHFIRQLFILITLLRLIHLFPSRLFGFRWIESCRQDFSDYATELVMKIKALWEKIETK